MDKFIIETSARHVHLTKETIETLFGAGYELTVKKELSQPGQYACNERVTVVGPKKELAGVSILGPCRKATQIEISLTDVFAKPCRIKSSAAASTTLSRTLNVALTADTKHHLVYIWISSSN